MQNHYNLNNKVIVTGGSGHLGFLITNILIDKGFTPVLLLRSKNKNTELLESRGAKLILVNLFDSLTYEKYLTDADCLFHCAAENTTNTSNENQTLKNTVLLAENVIKTAIKVNVKTIVYTSSVVVLGRSLDKFTLIDETFQLETPESPYVKGKLLAEKFVQTQIDLGFDIRVMYPSWIIGEGDVKMTPPHKVIRDAVIKSPFFYFDGGISVADAREVALAHVNSWLIGTKSCKYILGGDNIEFKDFYSKIAVLTNQKKPFLRLPKWFIYYASILLQKIIGNRTPIDPKYVKSVVGSYSWYNSERAMIDLNYNVINSENLLKKGVVEAKKKIFGIQNIKISSDKQNKIDFLEDDLLLITGFPGWLGNRMIEIFINGDRFGNYAINRKIRLLVQPNLKELAISLPSNFEIVYGDVTDKKSLLHALEGVKAVYHLAGVIYPKHVKNFYEVNYKGTINLIDTCIEKGVQRFLFMSTDSTCGYTKSGYIFDEYQEAKPYKNYGKSKYLAEEYLFQKTKEGKINGTSLRGFWFFGPNMPVRNLGFIKMFDWPRQVVFGDGKNLRSISHIDNVVQAFVKAEKAQKSTGNWYWIGDEKKGFSVDEIYKNIAQILKKEYKPIYIPTFICSMLSLLDSLLGIFGRLNPTIHAAGKFHKTIAGSSEKACLDFDYIPLSTFELIKDDIKPM